MDTLFLSVRKVEDPHSRELLGEEVVDIFINGRLLQDIIYDVEAPFMIRDGKEPQRGHFASLSPAFVFLPCRNLLGEPDFSLYPYDEEGQVPLLRCGCGDIDCGPVYATIIIESDTVVWSDIGNPPMKRRKNPWDYSSLHFVFDKKQYITELMKRCPE